jgi:hypothetical protein
MSQDKHNRKYKHQMSNLSPLNSVEAIFFLTQDQNVVEAFGLNLTFKMWINEQSKVLCNICSLGLIASPKETTN